MSPRLGVRCICTRVAKTGWSIPWIVAGSAAVATAGAAGTLAVRTHQGAKREDEANGSTRE
jgi:hypothetical protein